MSQYTVERADKSDVWTATEGKAAGQQFQGWTLTLKDGNGSYEAQANTKLGNDFPGVGEKVDGDLIPGPRGRRFKRAFSGSGGGSNGTWKPRDPEETKRIVHQHAQKVAIAFLQVRAYLKEIQTVEIQDVFNIAARIREDVEKVK